MRPQIERIGNTQIKNRRMSAYLSGLPPNTQQNTIAQR